MIPQQGFWFDFRCIVLVFGSTAIQYVPLYFICHKKKTEYTFEAICLQNHKGCVCFHSGSTLASSKASEFEINTFIYSVFHYWLILQMIKKKKKHVNSKVLVLFDVWENSVRVCVNRLLLTSNVFCIFIKVYKNAKHA